MADQTPYQPINQKVDAVERANSNYNIFFPKAGLLSVGDRGLEFEAETGGGFIQIPWDMVDQVRVEIMFDNRYVRGFYIHTSDDQDFEFLVHHAKNILRAMRHYLPRETFVRNRNNIKNPFKKS